MTSFGPRLGLLLSISVALNLPLGYIRQDYERFTVPWWILIHAAIPAIIPLRRILLGKNSPRYVIPVNIAAAIVGQLGGGELKRRTQALEQPSE